MNFGLSVTPYNFQKTGTNFALSSKYCIIADQMGLGKTIQAIAVANHTRAKCLVVCPAFLKLNWVAEIEKLCSQPKHYDLYKKGLDIYSYKPELDDFIIINYEQVKHAEDLFAWATLVVADEGHYLKNGDAQRTIYFDKYLYENQPEYFLLLTGTPIQNRVEELYQPLVMMSYGNGDNGKNILDDYPSKTAFCNKFSHQVRMRINGFMVVKYVGVKNVELLQTYLDGKLIRRLQKDVLDLPDMVESEVIASYKQDKKLLREFENHKEMQGKDITAKAKSAALKAKFTIQYVKNLLDSGTCEKVVVFSDHVKPAEEIAAAFGVAAITGKMPMARRMELVNQFQTGDLPVFCATIGAASTGLTLTAANYMVLNDISYVPGNNEQAKKRIMRIGQDKKCNIVFVVGSFQDAYILNQVRAKMSDINEVLNER